MITRLMLCAALAVPVALPAVAAQARNQQAEAANKSTVLQLSQAMLGQAPLESLRRYFAHNLIQHDPLVGNGREAMLSWIATQRARSPAPALTVKHVVADGDKVLVHSQLSATPDNEMTGQNRYDLYRLAHGVVVERWSYAAAAPTRSASGNSAFNDAYQYATTPAPAVTEERQQLHRQLATALSEEVFSKRNFGIVGRMWSTGYLQHNPWLPNGRAPLQNALPYIAPAGGSYRVVHALAEGDLAVVCAHGQQPGGNPRDEFSGYAVCDMYRMVDLEMVEHWDVSAMVPATSANGHSMFSSVYRGNASGH